jgi:hypothetical protein
MSTTVAILVVNEREDLQIHQLSTALLVEASNKSTH